MMLLMMVVVVVVRRTLIAHLSSAAGRMRSPWVVVCECPDCIIMSTGFAAKPTTHSECEKMQREQRQYSKHEHINISM